MNDIKFGNWFKLFQSDFYINCKRPVDFETKIPDIETQEFKKMNLSDIYEYFRDIAEKNVIIDIIDGKFIGENGWCSYCKSELQKPIHSCTFCKKEMCNLCWEEKTEEIAKNNGAKNWLSRKDMLFKCFSHPEHIVHGQIKIFCDLCNINSDINTGTWYTNREENKDVCFSCYTLKTGEAFMETISGTWETVIYPNRKTTSLGSVLDWIPVLCYEPEDGDWEYILTNINKKSTLYGKTALAIIFNNSMAIYTWNYSLEKILELLNGKTVRDFFEENGIEID